MSLHMAYALKKRQKMASGGAVCEACRGGRCMKHGGMMAEGGEVKEKSKYGQIKTPGHPDPDRLRRLDQWEIDNKQGKYAPKKMAEGGLIDRIMAKRMSEGGLIANDVEPIADDEPNDFDVLPEEDDLESSYTGANSGDEDGGLAEDDMIDRIMLKRKKDRMPSPA